MGRYLVPLPAATTSNPAGTRPIHHFADQRRLIPVSKRIHDARFPRALREQRTRERVGLDIHHHDMFVFLNNSASAWRMPAAGLPVASMMIWVAGDAMAASASSVTHVVVWSACAADVAVARSDGQPTRASDVRARWIEIGDGDDMQTGRAVRLRQEHQPNLPAPMRATRSGFPSTARRRRRA